MQRNKADSGISTWATFVIGASDGERSELSGSSDSDSF